MTTQAAGHEFPFIGGRCSCGISWLSIRNVTADDVGQPGIAHHGNLTDPEFRSIVKLRDAEHARIDAATRELSGGYTVRDNPIEVVDTGGAG